MKAVFATIILSILSAVAGVLAVTQLCAKKSVAASPDYLTHPATAQTGPYPRQRLQQWINH